MASQVLSGASNASYTNNTGQNVRLIINYMSNVTSMTWAGVNVTATATTIGKDIQNITGDFRGLVLGRSISRVTNLRVGTRNNGYQDVRELTLSNEKVNIQVSGVVENQVEGSQIQDVNVTLGTRRYSYGDISSGSSSGILTNILGAFAPFLLKLRGGDRPEFAGPNIFYVPQTISKGGNFPAELMLAPNQSFSAICGAFNAIVIKEDGT